MACRVRVREAAPPGRRKSTFQGTMPESTQLSGTAVLSCTPRQLRLSSNPPKYSPVLERMVPLALEPVGLGDPGWGWQGEKYRLSHSDWKFHCCACPGTRAMASYDLVCLVIAQHLPSNIQCEPGSEPWIPWWRVGCGPCPLGAASPGPESWDTGALSGSPLSMRTARGPGRKGRTFRGRIGL